MDMSNYADEAWKKFREVVLPPEAHPTQVSDMQKAFYAGLESMLVIQNEILDAVPDDDEDKQAELLEEVYNEIEMFFNKLSGATLQ